MHRFQTKTHKFHSQIGYLVLSLEDSKAAQNLDSIVLKNDFYQKILVIINAHTSRFVTPPATHFDQTAHFTRLIYWLTYPFLVGIYLQRL